MGIVTSSPLPSTPSPLLLCRSTDCAHGCFWCWQNNAHGPPGWCARLHYLLLFLAVIASFIVIHASRFWVLYSGFLHPWEGLALDCPPFPVHTYPTPIFMLSQHTHIH